MRVITEDLLSIESGIIVHQVNTDGVMGAGIAKSLREKYPYMYNAYQTICSNQRDSSNLMGKLYTYHSSPLVIVNLFAQTLSTNAGDGRRTSYDATVDGWHRIKRRALGRQVYVPYGIGCGLGGGDWNIYSAIVDAILPDVIACKII